MSREKITHKELLTFSNLTNLEWEFVNLEAIREGQFDNIAGEVSSGDNYSTQLIDLLDPKCLLEKKQTQIQEQKEQFQFMEKEKKALPNSAKMLG